jgi:uncharacterized HAD superfamily protein
MKQVIAVDLDGTLCAAVDNWTQYHTAKPIQQVIDVVNKLYKEGNDIIIYTARPWNDYNLTEIWLKKHKVKYTRLVCGKIPAAFYVCDRTLSPQEFIKIHGG